MIAQQPKGVLITFDEQNQSFNICTVPRASVDDLMSRALVVPWALADSNFRLDDEVARSIGGLVFRLLATAQGAPLLRRIFEGFLRRRHRRA